MFEEWFNEAKKSEINDPNALALATVGKKGIPSVRMVLLKGFSNKGFIFYTNLNSRKSNEIKSNSNASMCFHWKSLLRQIRIVGKLSNVLDTEADNYYESRSYGSKIGAWASMQSQPLKNRVTLLNKVEELKKKFDKNVPRPKHWGGFQIIPNEFEFWQDGDFRLHDRFILKPSDHSTLWECQRYYP